MPLEPEQLRVHPPFESSIRVINPSHQSESNPSQNPSRRYIASAAAAGRDTAGWAYLLVLGGRRERPIRRLAPDRLGRPPPAPAPPHRSAAIYKACGDMRGSGVHGATAASGACIPERTGHERRW